MARKSNKKITYSQQYSFGLEPYRGRMSRTKCPHCGDKSFSNYIFLDTGERIDEGRLGMCNHIGHCRYHEPPTSEDLKGRKLIVPSTKIKPEYLKKDETPSVIPHEKLLLSRMGVKDNLSCFLFDNFDPINVKIALDRYMVGSWTCWGEDGCTTFFLIDSDLEIRSAKIIQYNATTGKRVKEPFPKINWLHSIISPDRDFNLKQCWFGEHLTNNIPKSVNQVHVVESEKTALICTIQNPNLFWVATGGMNNIKEDLISPFGEYELVFYPDKGSVGFEQWEDKLEPFKGDYNIKINNFLESCDYLEEGDDIGDYLILKNKKQ